MTASKKSPQKHKKQPLHVITLVDHITGHTKLCRSLAATLQAKPAEVRVQHARWSRIRHLLGFPLASRYEELPEIPANGDTVIISAGRRLAPLNLYYRNQLRQQGKRAITLFILDPGSWRRAQADLTVVPLHDRLKNDGKTLSYLTLAKPEIPEPPKEYRTLVVLVGGRHRHGQLRSGDVPVLADFIRRFRAFRGRGVNVFASVSRRTGVRLSMQVRQAFHTSKFYDPASHSPNPYNDFLSAADMFLITGDSVSMIDEAILTGKPVYVYAPWHLTGRKHGRYIKSLEELGLVTRIDQGKSLDGFVPGTRALVLAYETFAEKLQQAVSSRLKKPVQEAGS